MPPYDDKIGKGRSSAFFDIHSYFDLSMALMDPLQLRFVVTLGQITGELTCDGSGYC